MGDPLQTRQRVRSPTELGKRDWLDTARRVKDEIGNDNLGIISAGVAFYAFLALVPALSALVSVWGLLASPGQVESQLSMLERVLPPSGYELVSAQLSRIAAGSSSALGWGLALSLVLTLWSAKQGMQAIVRATNIAYDEDETRGFFKMAALSLGLTLGAIVMTVLLIGIVVAAPVVLGAVGLGDTAETITSVARWPLAAALVIGVLIALYRWSPDRDSPRWSWVVPGALLATIGWLGVSVSFSFYVGNFGKYNETYGALGAVVVLMMWFWLSAFVVLLGAELNSEAELQAGRRKSDPASGAPDR